VRKLRAIIVDDEPLARRNILALIKRDPEIEIAAECGSGREAIAAAAREKPDLMFLDVQMPECDGFDVVDQLGSKRCCEIVFVTAYDRYAVDAFDAGAIDYLLKPFDDERFARMLARVKERALQRKGETDRPEWYAAREPGRVSFVRTADIDWIEAADYYSCLHVGKKSHLLRRSINSLEEELDQAVFCRIHRSAIVNLGRVSALELNEAGEYEVQLQDGTRLRVSRRCRSELQARMRA
jgi:two-component system LytT family response regulator